MTKVWRSRMHHEYRLLRCRSAITPFADSPMTPAIVALRITVLGAPHLQTPLTPISPSKPIVHAAALYLGLSRGRSIRRGELARLIWPDEDDGTHGERIRWLIHQLKRAGLSFPARDPLLGLDVEKVSLDVDVLDAPTWTDDILDISHGDVLAAYDPQISDLFDRWISDARDALRARVLHGLDRWLVAARAEALWHRTEQLARRILMLDEYHEGASIALAESLAVQGRRWAAIDVLGRHEAARYGDDPVPASALLRARLRGHREAAQVAGSTGETRGALVGRASHLARILDATPGSGTRRIGVAGPAGIGKTRLLDEVAAVSAMRGEQVLRLRCAREDALRPRSLVTDLAAALRDARGGLGASPETLDQLRAFAADPASVLAPASGRTTPSSLTTASVFRALVELLGAVSDEGPLTVIIDDVHRAEPSSWSILALLFPFVSASAVTWLLSLRAEKQQTANRQFRTIFPPDEASCDQSRDIHWLTPLTNEAIRELCVARAASRAMPDGALSRMIEHAAGIPFFAEALIAQLCSTGHWNVPPAVARLTQARLDRMGAAAELVLATIAVLQDDASAAAVETVSMLDPRALVTATRSLEEAGIVTFDGGVLRAAKHWRSAITERTPRTTWQFLERAASKWRESTRPVLREIEDPEVAIAMGNIIDDREDMPSRSPHAREAHPSRRVMGLPLLIPLFSSALLHVSALGLLG